MRENIVDSLGYATLSGITVRVCSGDNLDSTAAVAVKAGIITELELRTDTNCAMDASVFREAVGDVIR